VTDRRAILLLIGIVAVAYSDILVLRRGFYLGDIITYHYPMKKIVREVVGAGEFPYWNRFNSGGQPLAANPAYEVFYPPQWLTFLPNFHYGFQLHILLHFAIAAIGMFALLRSLGLGVWASLFGAVTFVFCGPYLSLGNKLPLLFSLSWMPWTLFFARRFVDGGRALDFAGGSFVLALQLIIAEPTILMQTALLIAAYLVWGRLRRALVARALVLALTAALLAAIQLVPTFDFARDSVRSEAFSFQVVSNWSMPPARVAELVFPSLFRHITNEQGAPAISAMYPDRHDAFLGEIYPGLIVTIFALSGLLAGVRGSAAVIGMMVVSILLAAGDHTPLLRLLYDAHLVRAIRYPEKFIVLGVFVWIVWAAMILNRIIAGDRKLRSTALLVASLCAAIAVLLALVMPENRDLGTRSFFALNAGRAIAALILVTAVRKRVPAPWPAIVVALLLADLCWTARALVPRMPGTYFDAPPLLAQLGSPAVSRVYPQDYWDLYERDAVAESWFNVPLTPLHWWMFRNALWPNTPARWGWELALEEDVDETTLKHTRDLRDALLAERRTRIAGAEEPFLRMSNVGWRMKFRASVPEHTIDTNPVELEKANYPRYYFARSFQRAVTAIDIRSRLRAVRDFDFADVGPFIPAAGEVTDVVEHANETRLTTWTTGQSLLMVSVTRHKYWQATIDGRSAPLIPANIAYQALVVPQGIHQIELHYRNPLIAIGAAVTLLTLLGIVAIVLMPATLFDFAHQAA
jgi:hypothetical protein